MKDMHCTQVDSAWLVGSWDIVMHRCWLVDSWSMAGDGISSPLKENARACDPH